MSNVQPPYPDGSGQQPGPPSYPAPPPSGYGLQPPARVEQPSSIRTAVRLMWAGAVVSLLSLVVTLVTLGGLKGQVRDQLAATQQDVTPEMVDAAFAAAIGAGVAGAVIAIGLWLWMAWKNGQGRRWARVVATVLGAINVVSTLFTLSAGASTAPSLVVSVVGLVLAVAILVLLWRKDSSAFYAARSARPAY